MSDPRPSSELSRSVYAVSRSAVGRVSRKLFRKLASSARLDATAKFLRRQLWAWPILAAAILGGLGWWVNNSVEDAMREQRVAQMTSVLNADVEALRTWMRHQQQTAEHLAEQQAVRTAARDILATTPDGKPDPEAIQRLRKWHEPRAADARHAGFFLVSPDGVIVAADGDMAQGKVVTGYRKEFFAGVLAGRSGVSKPYRALMWLPDADGQLRMGVPTMFAAAPVRDDTGAVIAAIGFRLRPDDDFTRILQTARAGQSGETYAFDRDGLMLSQSRFDPQLKRYGLLANRPEEKSVLTLQLRDPGANLAAREARPDVEPDDLPLTKPVSAAAAGGGGHDVEGYPDYRGVPSLGAWTWLDEYDFGVVTQVDRDEAFRPVYILRGVFLTMLIALLIAAIALFAAMVFMARQQARLRAAVLEAKQLGQYTLEEKLGAGGMGTVYRAKHAMLRRPTAVKLLNLANMTALAVARFEREVQFTSGLTHPNTVAIYDYGRTPEGVFYYAMEYLEGINLDDLVVGHGPLPEARAVYLLRQVCGALAEAHATGVVHRDVKPANIFLTHRGGMHDFVKVLDFGLVKVADTPREANLTSANAVTGTPLYLSPEGISRPDSVGPPADVYALGAVAYFLLIGSPVFDGSTVLDICMQHINEPPTPPSARGVGMSGDLERLILRCLAKSPTDRPATAATLLAELDECQVAGTWTAATAAAWWANPPARRAATLTASPPPPTPAYSNITQVFVPAEPRVGSTLSG